jgi:hypothetical protein
MVLLHAFRSYGPFYKNYSCYHIHDDLSDNFEIDERIETHAAILDRMLA